LILGGENAPTRFLTQLDKALEIAPNDADALAPYAMIAALDLSLRHSIAPNDPLAASTSYRKTMAITERGISTGKHLSEFYSAKGVLLDVVSRHHEARSWYGEAAKQRSDPYWRLLSSASYGIEKDYLNALDQVERAIEEGAKGSSVDFYYGRCLAAIGENDRALALFQNVRQRRGYFYQLIISMQDSYWFSWHPIKSSYYELLSALYIVRRSKHKALRHIVSAARKFVIPIMTRTSSIIEAIAKKLPLLSRTKMANLCDPGNPHVSLGLSLMRTENVQAAKKMFAIAVRRSPRFNSWMNYCSASIMTGDWDEAQRAYFYLRENWPDKVPEGYAAVISERVLPGNI
jgi:tetratricopeptide (TPR) repeat protein